VSRLEVAWRWNVAQADSAELRQSRYFVSTPLMLGGKLYVATGAGRVVALDPSTGDQLWVFDPRAYDQPRGAHGGLKCRGIEYWTDGEDERIILATGGLQLFALDPETGKPKEGFGEEGGWTDLAKGLGQEIQRNQYNIMAPTIVCRDTIVIGSVVNDYGVTQKLPPGHVRGYDVRTGKMKWIFHSIPQEGEYGVETWEDGSWEYTGNTNVWSMMSADEELGYVYLPFGTPTNDHYGGHRPGNNLFGESLVCLDAETGERIWHFQAVHHGIWDYDFPCAPNLLDITVDGERIKAVAQVSKQGFTYVFNRVTGEPIWPIVERPVAPSTVPGEKTSPTQPFPTKPPPFETQGVTEDTLIDLTEELKARAAELLEDYLIGPLFTPPIVGGQDGKRGLVQLPGMLGGANWPGATVDPETGILYVPSVTRPLGMALRAGGRFGDLDYNRGGAGVPNLDGLPVIKPPWGRITAIDLNTGEFAWQVPHGDGPRDHPAIADLDLGRLGSSYSSGLAGAGAMVTKTLLIANQAKRGTSGAGESGFLRAFDKATGELIWEMEYDAAPVAPPMTYVHDGRQYIAFTCGGRGRERQLIVFALPRG
jgi:quinoprotein glucose dehydrogenase